MFESIHPGACIQSVQQEGDHVRVGLVVEQESQLFAGHFPHHPMLPGAVLIGLVVNLCRRQLQTGALSGIRRVKLLAPVTPGKPFTIELWRQAPGSDEVRFEVTAGDGSALARGAVLVSR